MKRTTGKHVQKPDTEDHSELQFLVSFHLQIPDTVDGQNENIDITQKCPNSANEWRCVLRTAVTRYGRVVRPFNGGAEEDGIEEKGSVEDGIGSYCTIYKPSDFEIVIDGKDSAEKEEEGGFDAERDRKIHDFEYESKLCKNVELGTTNGQSDRMNAYF